MRRDSWRSVPMVCRPPAAATVSGGPRPAPLTCLPAARTAAQLIVDAAGFVALGSDDVQAARRDDLLVAPLPVASHLLASGLVRLRRERGELRVEIAAEHDVGAAAGHVRGDGDGAG